MNFMAVPSYDGHMASPYILEIHYCLSTFFDTIRPVCFKQTYIYISNWPLLFKHCATSRKVAGSIPDGVRGIFLLHNPSGCTKALGLTQPLTEMSTRNISRGGKGGRCLGVITLPPSCTDCLEIWEPRPAGILRACPGLYRVCFASPIPILRGKFLGFILLILAQSTEIRRFFGLLLIIW